MRSKNFFLFFFCASNLLAQNDPATPAWFVQSYGFIARYHPAIDYKPGAGAGLRAGYSLRPRWLSFVAGFEYTRAAQELRFVDGLHEMRVNLYQSFFALRGCWPLKPQAVALFASVHNGLSFFRPQPVVIDAGTLGRLNLHPGGETKFVAAWESGLAFHFIEGATILFFVKQNFSRFVNRRAGGDHSASQWRPYWNYATGLSYHF